MQRIFASARVALCVAGCASPLLIASNTPAASQLLDPGWQLVYSGQPNYAGSSPGGDGGLIQHVFGDGAGQRAIPRPYQPAPAYYQQQPPPQPPQGYQPTAPVYYQQQPHTYPGGPAYYRQVPAQQIPPQQARGYQPAPAYYQRVPPQQQRVYPGGPVYYQQGPAQQQARSYQPAPTSYQEQPQQQRGSQPTPAYYQQQVPPQTGAQPAPVYSQQLALPQRAYQPAPVYYQGPAQRPGLFQPAAMSYKQAPTQQQAGASQPPPAYYQQPQQQDAYQLAPAQLQPVTRNDPAQGYAPSGYGDMAHAPADPKFERQVVDYQGNEPPGTIIIDTPHFFLYLVADGGKALRYGIGVGRPGFTWAGVKEISAMREWPDWYPPIEMLQRRPDLPRFMPGGPDNPLGARALYLGSTLYRIHGSNEPWTIGTQVSSGCIRLRNEDVIDLYGRVKVGTKVVVI